MGLFVRLIMCITFAGLLLYKWVDKQNELTELRLSIPVLAKEVKEIGEKNLELEYLIEKFEDPSHLIEVARRPEYGHLKYPIIDQIILLPEQPSESRGSA